jgi:hypothetical protein
MRFLLLTAVLVVAVTGSGQERLGRVVFPTSGSPAAQADFLRGVAWLHSFGYEEASMRFAPPRRSIPPSRWPTGARR